MSARPEAEIDVVVVSYNSRDELRACVEPLAREPRLAVCVVDNASSDGSSEVVEDLPIRLVRGTENVGFARGSNRGWQIGTAPYVLFLNPDARIEPQSVRALAGLLDREPGVGIAGPRIERDDGSLHFSIRRTTRLRSTFAQAFFLHRLAPAAGWVEELVRDPAAYERQGPHEWLSGACLLVRRSLLEELGGFDERFFLYCEDMDLCVRARAAGFEVVFVPEALARHAGGASAPGAVTAPMLARSRAQFATKHFHKWAAALERLGIALGELTHALTGLGDVQLRKARLRAAAIALKRP